MTHCWRVTLVTLTSYTKSHTAMTVETVLSAKLEQLTWSEITLIFLDRYCSVLIGLLLGNECFDWLVTVTETDTLTIEHRACPDLQIQLHCCKIQDIVNYCREDQQGCGNLDILGRLSALCLGTQQLPWLLYTPLETSVDHEKWHVLCHTGRNIAPNNSWFHDLIVSTAIPALLLRYLNVILLVTRARAFIRREKVRRYDWLGFTWREMKLVIGKPNLQCR